MQNFETKVEAFSKLTSKDGSGIFDKISLIRNLVAEARIDDALDALNEITKNKGRINSDVANLQSEYQNLKKQEMLGIVTTTEANKIRNRLTKIILDLTSDLPSEKATPPASEKAAPSAAKPLPWWRRIFGGS